MQLQGELDAKDDEIHRMQIKLSDLLNEVNQMKNVKKYIDLQFTWKGI